MPNPDLFICRYGHSDPIRQAMFDVCLLRWSTESLTLHVLSSTKPDFQRQRRIWAEDQATSPIYILSDDDCLLPDRSPVNDAIMTMKANPDFAMISLWPSNATIQPWTPGDRLVVTTDDVMEHVSVGGIRFIRKGLMAEWPEFAGPGYDREHADQLRRLGYRVGYFRKLSMNHLGEHYSQVWRTQ